MSEPDISVLKKRGYIQQRQKDYVAMRLRVVAGTVPADHLSTIQEVANKYGSGELHLTSRQCVEIPFIKKSEAMEAADTLESAGIRLGQGGAAVRTVTGCPGSRVCPRGLVDTRGLAERVDEGFYGVAAPHKFKVAFSGCPSSCVKPQINDFGVWGVVTVGCDEGLCNGCGACAKACRSGAVSMDGKLPRVEQGLCVGCGVCSRTCPKQAMKVASTEYAITVGGKMGRAPRFGDRLPITVNSPDQVLEVLVDVLGFFKDQGKPGERLSDTVVRMGIQPLADVINSRLELADEKVSIQ